MVRHWLREQDEGWRRSIAINGFGAVATAIVTRHLRGRQVRPRRVAHRHHHPGPGRRDAAHRPAIRRRRIETEVSPENVIGPPRRHQRVIVPAADVTRDVVQAVRFARTMSDDVTAVHVTDDLEAGERIRARFERQLPGVPLVIVESPFRSLVRPLVRFLEDAAEKDAEDVIVVLLPEYVPRHWWERFLYNENGQRIQRALLGHANILVAEVPYRRSV